MLYLKECFVKEKKQSFRDLYFELAFPLDKIDHTLEAELNW